MNKNKKQGIWLIITGILTFLVLSATVLSLESEKSFIFIAYIPLISLVILGWGVAKFFDNEKKRKGILILFLSIILVYFIVAKEWFLLYDHDYLNYFYLVAIILSVYGIKLLVEKEQKPDESKPNNQDKKNSYFKWALIFFIIIVLTLPFHYIPSRGMVFPKNSLTFSYTIITEYDINSIIERYNNSSFLERQAMNNEPVVRKLMEKGIIVETNSENK